MEWTQDVLTKENAAFLKERPETHVIDQVTLAHGSPRQPVFEYLLDTESARENFSHFENDYCFIGHSHVPLMFALEKDEVKLGFPPPGQTQQLIPRAIINPGSVGQPRDRDRRASYALFDPEFETWAIHRVEYDIIATQEAMRQADLPMRHIERLAGGW